MWADSRIIATSERQIGDVVGERDKRTTAMLRLHLLGGFRAQRDGVAIADSAWSRPTARSLVKLLAIQPQRRMHAELALEFLWPDLAPDSADASLRKALTFARKALEPDLPPRAPSSYLDHHQGMVALTGPVWIDAVEMEALAPAALEGGDEQAYEAALALYSGELLPEDRYADWAEPKRAALAALHDRLQIGLADLLQQQGRYGAAADRLREVLARDATDEDVHRRLMTLAVLSGSRHEALRQYQRCREALAGELGVEPDPETEALYGEIASHASRPGVSMEGMAPLPSAVRRFPDAPLFGRERSLDLIERELRPLQASPPDGRRSIVFIGGEAGVGKTRLAAEFARRAHGEGAAVLWGGSYEAEGQAPYAPVAEAIDEHIRNLPISSREALAERFPDLGGLVPALRALGELRPITPATDSERPQFFAAVAGLLDAIAGDRPVLLVLDDLHLADQATLQLLHYLGRTGPDHTWLIVATHRYEDTAGDSNLESLRVRLARDRLSSSVDLLRLAREDCDRLTAALLPGALPDRKLLDRVYDLSLGNALFVHELVETLQALGLMRRRNRWSLPDRELVVPRRVRDLFMVRAARLGEHARQVLSTVATAGMETPFAVLRGATELGDAVLFDALDATLAEHVLEERATGFAFSHPLLREIAYGEISHHRRAYLHLRLATTLETEGSNDVDALARHFVAGGERAKATHYLEKAGDRALAVFAHAEAETRYTQALDLVEVDEVRARLQRKLGQVFRTTARFDEALRLLGASVEICRRREDVRGEARAAVEIGLVHSGQGTASEGLAVVQAAMALLPEEASQELASLYAAYVTLLFDAERMDQCLDIGARGAVAARAAGDDLSLAAIEMKRGTACMVLESHVEGRRIVESILEIAERTRNYTVLDAALVNLATSYHSTGEERRARHYATRALVIAEQIGNPLKIAFAAATLGVMQTVLGEHAEARVCLERAVRLTRDLPPTRQTVTPLHTLAQLDLNQGRWSEARSLLEEALGIALRFEYRRGEVTARSFLAELELQEGHPERVFGHLEPIFDDDGSGTNGFAPPTLLAARAYLELGDIARAEGLTRAALQAAETQQKTHRQSASLATLGAVYARQEQYDQADQAFTQALQIAARHEDRMREANARYDWGVAYRDRGEREKAFEQLDTARAIFEQLGMTAFASSARVALEAVGPPFPPCPP